MMLRFRTLVFSLAGVAIVWGVCPGLAGGADVASYIREIFSQELHRNPTGYELNYHSGLLRNQGPLENYIVICGSDEFFVRRTGSDNRTFVEEIYRVFLGRNPRPDELSYWVIQFQQAGNNRQQMLRLFLGSNGITRLPGSVPSQPGPPSSANAPQIAADLVTQSGMFATLVRNEMGYAGYGAAVIGQAEQFRAFCNQFQQTVNRPSLTDRQWTDEVNNLARSLHDLETVFNRVPAASWNSRNLLQRLSRLVTAALTAQVVRPGSPIQLPSSLPGPGYAEVQQFSLQLGQFVRTVQSRQFRGPVYQQLKRDVQGLAIQTSTLDLQIRQGRPRNELKTSMRQSSPSLRTSRRGLDRPIFRCNRNGGGSNPRYSGLRGPWESAGISWSMVR